MMASILIVEDDDAEFSLLKFSLERDGHRISRASDGISGLIQALKEGHDLIVMNMRLPEMAGWELAQRLKATPHMKATPIIGLSANTELQRKARDAGCEEFLLKPFSPNTLNGLVRKYSQESFGFDGS
jgi:two-component system phosphate regulon response regulator PhoB